MNLPNKLYHMEEETGMAVRKCPECGQGLSDREYEEALRNVMVPHLKKDSDKCGVCGKSREAQYQ